MAALIRCVCVALVILGVVGGCSSKVTVGYKPPLVPVEFEIGTDGEVSVSVSQSITTPVGEFSLGVESSAKLKEVQDKLKDDETLLTITRPYRYGQSTAAYKIGQRGQMTACLDGHVVETISADRIDIKVRDDDSVVRLVPGESACDAGESSSPQAGGATAAYVNVHVQLPGSTCTNATQLDFDSRDGQGALVNTGTSILFDNAEADLTLNNCGPDSQNTLESATGSSLGVITGRVPGAQECISEIRQRPAGQSVVPQTGQSICAWTNDGNLALLVITAVQHGDSYRVFATATMWPHT